MRLCVENNDFVSVYMFVVLEWICIYVHACNTHECQNTFIHIVHFSFAILCPGVT